MAVSGGNVKAGPVQAPVLPLLILGFGAYLMWFAVRYWRQDLKWPSDPVKSVLQGKGLPSTSAVTSESAQLTAFVTQDTAAVGASSAAESVSEGGGSGGSADAYQGPVSAGSAQNTAQLLLSKYGWTVAQMPDLIKLWTQESGWDPTARNPSSGAFGIAQALGHGGADTAAPDGTNEYGAEYGLTAAEAQAANGGSARWQIEWGLGYILATYGSPDAAWAHEEANNWY